MITNLAAKNFKSWADTGPIQFGRITGLFGTNSSGKTSIIQLLLLLKQTADSPDRNQVLALGDERSLVELGTLKEVVFSHDLTRSLEISLDWKLDERLSVPDITKKRVELFGGDKLGITTQIEWRETSSSDHGRSVVKNLAYQIRRLPVWDAASG